MNMSTVQTVTAVCGMIAAIGGILALVFKLVRWIDRQKAQDQEIQEIKVKHEQDTKIMGEELTVICFGLLAALDGLKQLGANGNVSKAHDALDKHLNKKAHK